jgi:hypothetical protein
MQPSACHAPLSSLVSPRLSSMESSHVAAARRWCAYSRIHSIIDVARFAWPSSPRDDPAPDAKGSGMARLTTSSRLVPGRPAAAVYRDPRAINQNSSPLAFSRFCTCEATILTPLSPLPIRGHDLAQYPAFYRRSYTICMTCFQVHVALTLWSDGRWPPRSSLARGPPSWAR